MKKSSILLSCILTSVFLTGCNEEMLPLKTPDLEDYRVNFKGEYSQVKCRGEYVEITRHGIPGIQIIAESFNIDEDGYGDVNFYEHQSSIDLNHTTPNMDSDSEEVQEYVDSLNLDCSSESLGLVLKQTLPIDVRFESVENVNLNGELIEANVFSLFTPDIIVYAPQLELFRFGNSVSSLSYVLLNNGSEYDVTELYRKK